MGHVLVIDQGTTSTRAIVFDGALAPVATAQEEFPQHFPQPGWVEHDPEDLWRTTLSTARAALAKSGLAPGRIAAIGIANQRETTLVWDRATGRPIGRAIVWQDRRTASMCDALDAQGHGALVAERSGLRLDPYFSATKLAWMLDRDPGLRARAEAGELAFGTVDSFLLWRLTGGAVHATDATNAGRTALLDIHTGRWDDDLLALFRIPRAMLPTVKDCAGEFGTAAAEHFGAAIPVRGIAGDQHAALIGQACFQSGMIKSTYGTGCFVLLNTGPVAVPSRHRMLTTIAYQLAGRRSYALEGSIFVAGAAVQWLRDGLGVIARADEMDALAAASDPDQAVYLVPAFVGLGAPHWNSQATGLITGIGRATTRRELARAALESVAFQTRDLLEAMHADLRDPAGPAAGTHAGTIIRVDGGMSASDWTMQFLADTLAAPVDRPAVLETTARGAAWLAGFSAGIYPDAIEFAATWSAERRFMPATTSEVRRARYRGWQDALARTLLPAG
jgi:glycerol kinase